MIFSIFSSGGQYIQQSRIEGIIRNISVIFLIWTSRSGFLIYSSVALFIRWNGTICVIFVEGII